MAYAERDNLQFPGQREYRERARKRNLLTQIAMFGIGVLGALGVAALLYFVAWLLWLAGQTVAGQTQTYIENAATAHN
ncbi:hypothetical protein [Sphingosinicella rhizophila]|uniref:Serine protease n=1 Tax=Sphingosinicella rhizophila TaxID=3050082 RepID=A0ABU3Q561_9SPHN|nr:hypothetical protein [Sphingosinicella sp. GR2756]MDT9598204.1 hypothetical protein [Sphingosinicella sp. GR2756]